jgi:hypothetical protein
MTKPFSQLKKETEERLEEVGRVQSKMFKRRVWELCQKLRADFPQIDHLNYCNGDFWFGDSSQINYQILPCVGEGGREYREKVNNLLDLSDDRLSEIVGWKDKHTKIVKELNDIFNYISYDNPYMECYCLDFTKDFAHETNS